jgi:hypothetical protein
LRAGEADADEAADPEAVPPLLVDEDGEGGGEVYRGGGFTDSTFLIGDSEDACQGRSSRRVRGDR